MKSLLNRQGLVTAVAGLLLCLPLLAAAAFLVSKYNWAEQRLAELEPRYARLLGLEGSRNDLARALADTSAMMTLYVYPVSQDVSQAGNDAQQRIRNIATTAGLSIVSSQVLPPKVENLFDRIPLLVRLEGELPALQAALVVLAEQSPAINFEGITVQTVGAVKAEVPQRLSIQFNLFVLRARS